MRSRRILLLAGILMVVGYPNYAMHNSGCLAVDYVSFAADDVNIALAKWGATARASSEFDSSYSAENAIDGKWASSGSDKWNTRSGWNQAEPHWLIIDLSAPRRIHRIVIRHEGVLGGGEKYNTSDYRLQYTDSPQGTWTDIIPPVKKNRDNVTEHEFNPVTVRSIRLLITKGEPNANEYARIFEVEAYSKISDLKAPLAGITFDSPYKRKTGGRFEVKAYLDAVIPPSLAKGMCVEVRTEGNTIARYDAGDLTVTAELWVPVTGKGGKALLELVCVTNGGESTVNRISYSADAPGYFTDGAVYIISSSHQDIAWMNSPDVCIRDRDRKVITPALERLRENPDLRFSVETTLQLMEYLERHPERKEEIQKLTREGRLEWGATYHQPYESMYPGESLIRQVYLGRKWLKKTLPGCDSHIAWNPDVPARAMQMPQILAKAGIPYLLMSRHEEGFYNWMSPDGSGVVAYSPGHYHTSGMIFRAGTELGEDGTTIIQKYKNFKDSAISLSNKLSAYDDYFRSRKIQPRFGVVMSSDFTGPVEMDNLLKEWSAVREDSSAHFSLPGLKYSTGEGFLNAVTEGNPVFDTIVGERPDVWLYIHGPTHHKALTACREAGWVLPAAETFATVDAVLSGGFKNYPADEFDLAWRKAIYPDHGWGGKNGHITDRVFREAFETGRDMGRSILRRSLKSISARVQTKKDAAPLFIFNHLSWKRTGPVECTLDMFGAETGDISIIDSKGNVVPHQVVSRRDGSGFTEDEKMYVVFIAEDVPPVGYATYYAIPRKDAGGERTALVKVPEHAPRILLCKIRGPQESPIIENEFYRIDLKNNGIRRIIDKEIGKDILKADRFGGGDVFTMQSVGNGAGEFADVQQPTMEGFERLSDLMSPWVRVEQGPVRITYETAGTFGDATVRLRVRLYNGIKRIDFETDILGFNGAKYREFRMAFPLNMEKGEIAYSVPMGVVEVGKSEIAGAAGERYVEPCAEVHPREVIDWFSASNGDFGVTISSSVAVFDWIDPTGATVDYPVLQPLLLASRKSCHVEGNWYLQTGDHTFNFSLYSYKGGWKKGWKKGTEASQPLIAVTGASGQSEKTLPESMSFCSVDADNVFISTIKKCDDDDSVVIRCCELEGRDARHPEQSGITWFTGIAKADRTNIIEEEGRPIDHSGNTLQARIGHHAIETFKIIPALK